MLEGGQDFVAANSGTIAVRPASVHVSNVFRLMSLAAELRLERLQKLCAGELSALSAVTALSYLTAEWVAGASHDALRAAVTAIKDCK